ncbi:MAG: ABC transporter permease [Acidobacteria bacterium]|nr:ABC transporter permease [Acidobacteriota bacterium]
MKVRRVPPALTVLAVLVVAWQICTSTGLLNPLFFPPPSVLFLTTCKMARSGELAGHLEATLTRLFIGAFSGSVLGLLCGVLMGAAAQLRRLLEPVISALYSAPKLTLLPMLMLFLGVGETPRILLIAASCFVLMSMHGLDAIRNINSTYIEMAVNYGAGRAMLVRKVYLPASLPQIFTGLRVTLGRALVLTVSVELVSSSSGLGSMIWMSWQTFSTEKLYIGVILSAALGAGIHSVLKRLESRIVPWRNG